QESKCADRIIYSFGFSEPFISAIVLNDGTGPKDLEAVLTAIFGLIPFCAKRNKIPQSSSEISKVGTFLELAPISVFAPHSLDQLLVKIPLAPAFFNIPGIEFTLYPVALILFAHATLKESRCLFILAIAATVPYFTLS